MIGVEFPDLGCNARCDTEDDARLSFRGVAGTVALAVCDIVDLLCAFVFAFKVSVRTLRVMFTTSVANA